MRAARLVCASLLALAVAAAAPEAAPVATTAAAPAAARAGRQSSHRLLTEHRPPNAGVSCRKGQRWVDACRECRCEANRSLYCQQRPCDPAAKQAPMIDGFVLPPHQVMKTGTIVANHKFHIRKTGITLKTCEWLQRMPSGSAHSAETESPETTRLEAIARDKV